MINTELIAVNAIVIQTFQPGQHLVAQIPTGDKVPSFDGYITIHKDKSKGKKSYINDIPTQVKGTMVENFSETRSYPLELADYQNYYRRGGCLLLVVEISKKDVNATKIFYKQLLPVDLKEIINLHGKQKTYSVRLRPLDETDLYTVCLKMGNQMRKQNTVLLETNQYKHKDFQQHIFTSLTYDPKRDSISDIMQHDFIHFGLKDNIQYPIGKGKIEAIAIETLQSVKVGEQVHNFKVMTKSNPPMHTWKIEDTILFSFDEDKKNLSYTVNATSLKNLIVVYNFLVEVFQSGKIEFNGFKADINIDEHKEALEQIVQTRDFFVSVEKTFEELGVSKEREFGVDFDQVINKMDLLQDMLVNQDYEGINISDKQPSFCTVDIGNIAILLFFNPQAERKFINPFKERIDVAYSYQNNENGKITDISPFLLLSDDLLKKASNLEFDVMKESLLKMELEDFVFRPVNDFILRCINAYDSTSNKELLRLPLELLNERKRNFEEETNYIISELNFLQISYRMNGKLNNEEFQRALKLKQKAGDLSDNNELLFGVAVLMESFREAEHYFLNLNDQTRSFYETLPIFKLYNDLRKKSSLS